MHYNKTHILLLSLVVEGLLVVVFFVWQYFREVSLLIPITLKIIGLGVLGSIPLFLLNYLLFGPLSQRVFFLKPCFEFKDRIVRPLAAELDWLSSAFVAVCAGFGEEVFFRGVIQSEAGIIIASLLFSIMHFGLAIGKYLFIGSIYVLIGVYFGLLYWFTGSLWVPIITHATYDYVALIYIRYWERQN